MGNWIRLLLPTEFIFIGFVLISTLILFFTERTIDFPLDDLKGFPWKSILGLTLGGILLKKRREKTVSILSLLRILLPFILIILVYPLVPALIQAMGRGDQDPFLHAMDRFLFFNQDPLLLMENWITWPVSEWMAFCYSSYGFILLTLIFWLFLQPDLNPLKQLILELTLCLTLGYLGYIFFPAIGPIYTQTFMNPIELKWMDSYKQVLMDQTRIDRDCFPSLHTAISLLMLIRFRVHFNRIFPYVALVLITIPLACVYLRYHYVVDVLFGCLLVAAVRIISKRMIIF